MADRARMWRRADTTVMRVVSRLVELGLVSIGIGYTLVSNDEDDSGLPWLGAFGLVATVYLVVGFVVVRRHALRSEEDAEHQPHWTTGPGRGVFGWLSWRSTTGQRFAFTLTVVASLIGMSGALSVIEHQEDTELGAEYTTLGLVAVVVAWALLHVGYARFYEGRFYATDGSGGGLEFPSTRSPGAVEFLYFAFTCGVSFAASDVTVVKRNMRWHVLVHCVIAFFYNAAVLAITISTVSSSTAG